MDAKLKLLNERLECILPLEQQIKLNKYAVDLKMGDLIQTQRELSTLANSLRRDSATISPTMAKIKEKFNQQIAQLLAKKKVKL